MARIFPTEVDPVYDRNQHSGELATLRMLQQALPDNLCIFHSVDWASIDNKRTHFGEIDFVILSPSGDIVVIEQKNGDLEEAGGELLKHYQGYGIGKSVFDQITRSREYVQQRWGQSNGRFGGLTIHPLVFLPDYRVKSMSSLRIERGHVVDAPETGQLASKIIHILGKSESNPNKQQAVMNFLLDSYCLTPDIHAKKEKLDSTFRYYADGLVNSLEDLEIQPYRLKVDGTAGCGKTLLASHFFHRSVREGRRTLYLCYNRPLADYVRSHFPEPGQVFTWFGFVDQFLKQHGATLDFQKMWEDKEFWLKAQEQLMEYEVPLDEQFDTILIDEGQDFEPIWWDLVRDLFLKDSPASKVLWIQDSDQDLRQIGWSPSEFHVTYHARKNFRTPKAIAEYIRSCFPFDFEAANPLRGGGVEVLQLASDAELQTRLNNEIKSLTKEGHNIEDIAILTASGWGKSCLYQLDTLGSYPLRKYTGDYSADGHQIYTKGELLLDTVNRFKGQQIPVVFLVDVDLAEGNGFAMRQMQAYVGMTRATYKLYLVNKY